MSRQKWIYDRELEKVVTAEEYYQRREQAKKAKYYVKDDTMAPLLNPADGKTYDSKSAFERATKEAGAEIIGNEYRGKSIEELTPKQKDFADPMPMISEWVEGGEMPEIPQQFRTWEHH